MSRRRCARAWLCLTALTLALPALAPRAAPAQPAGATAPPPDPGAPTWVHESWTVKDGLPVNAINTVIQDRTGYIWAATFDGLVRFDGVRFTVFNAANAEALPSNRVIGLTEGRDEALWLITEQGHVVRFRAGRFTNVPFGGARGDGVVTLVEDDAGAVWVGTPEGLWTLRRDSLVRVGRGTIDAPVTALAPRRDGSLWVGTSGAGIFRAGGDGRVARVAADPALDEEDVARMFEDRSGTLWVQGERALWSWRERPVRIRGLSPPFVIPYIVQVPATGALHVATAAGLYRIEADSALLVRPGSSSGISLWTDTELLWSVHGQDVLRDGHRVFTLPARRTVSSALVDREGSLWLGTDAGGLHRLKSALFTTFSLGEGVGHPNVYATYADRAGMIWLGTWGAGATRLDPVTRRTLVLGPGTLPGSVNSFHEDRDGRLWVGGGEGAGLYLCTLPAPRCSAAGPPELRGRSVLALHGDARGHLWVGATDLLLRHDGRAWTSFPSSAGGPSATVRAFASTRDGALWMGTNGGGLVRHRDGAFTHVGHADGLPGDLVRSLHVDADGWLWVGTEGRGLARLDPRGWSDQPGSATRRIDRIGAGDGLFDEVIHQILEDDAGRLWMNTNRGIFWVARAELHAFADGRAAQVHSTAYAERDGIRNREGNGGVQPAGAKGPDGRLWFPTQDGVVVVDPARVRGDRLAPPLVVEQVVAGGHVLLPARDAIALDPAQRDVQIEYTALTFLEPTNVRFRYRLDPYDGRWVDAGNRRTAFYTRVPPGRYTFRIQASDAGGGWHEPGVLLAMHVMPRVWETTVFRWAVAAALGALLFLAVRMRESRLRASAARLASLVDEQTATLRARERELADRNVELQLVDRAKTRFFANVSHELRTPLTLTIGPLEDLRARAGGDPQVERWLDIALRNARRLLRLVNQILDVAKLEAGALRLAPRPLDLAPFTRGIVAAFTPVAERQGLRLTAETPEALTGAFDADAVEKVLTNLLSNAIKFTPEGGAVRVELSSDRGGARLVVRDTGPGIPPEQVAHVFERFYQVDESTTRAQPGTGIGLSLVKELVELHGGTVAVESGSAGATFTAWIPPAAVVAGVAADPPVDAPRLAAEVALGHAAIAAPPADEDDARAEDVPTMLVVDDSADLRGYVSDHFAPRFRVLHAADGAEGIARARRHLPDVILSDVMMPGTDGHALVRALRASPETDFLAVILLTAQAGDDQRLEGLERGADDYLVKPFEMRELDVRVRNLIAARRRLRARFTSRPVEAQVVTPAGTAPADGLAPADAAYLARVREAARQGLGDPDFGVGELASAVAQDRSHLFRRVRQLSGESPSELLRRLRVEEGERLLRESSATVTDVAYAVGFNSLSYFCRCFQESYGATPAAYRSRVAGASD